MGGGSGEGENGEGDGAEEAAAMVVVVEGGSERAEDCEGCAHGNGDEFAGFRVRVGVREEREREE